MDVPFMCQYVNMCLQDVLYSLCFLLQVQWPGRQLREAAVELQESAQTEAQRRAVQHSHLSLILPPHLLRILTQGKGLASWQNEEH